MTYEFSTKGGVSILTEICRLSYPHLDTKRTNPKYPQSAPKYEAVLIFEPNDATSLWNAIVAVADRAWPAVQGPAGMVTGEMLIRQGVKKSPLHHGSEKPLDPVLQGKFFVNAKSTSAVGLVGHDGVTPIASSVLYAGCYVRAFMGIYPYADGAGIGIGLNALQFVRDCAPNERLDNRANATAAFASNPLPPGATPAPTAPPMGAPGGAYAATPGGAPPSWGNQPGAAPAYAQPAGAPVQGAPQYPTPGAPPGYAPPAGQFPPGAAR